MYIYDEREHDMKKDDFINQILKFSREDIRKFLEEKGKQPKPTPLMVRIKNNK